MDESQDNRTRDSSGMQGVQALAGEGLWYAALDEISLLIAASPDDESLREGATSCCYRLGLEETATDWQCAVRCTRDVENHHIKLVD